MRICDLWLRAGFIRQSSGREKKILEKSKKLKNTVQIYEGSRKKHNPK